MSKTRRVRIVVERHRRVSVGGSFSGPCPVCGCEVETFTRQEAADFLQVGLEDVQTLAAAGRIHAIFTVAGTYRVCKRSLLPDPQVNQEGGTRLP